MAQVTVQTIRNERAPGGDIPEVVKNYIAMHADRFIQPQTHDRDVEIVMKMSKRGIEKADAEAVAWLIWRARMVHSWTAVDRKPTLSWEQAVDSAWLKDELFKLCSDKRKHFYEERDARRTRLEQAITTGVEGDHGDKLSTKPQKALERRAVKSKDEVKGEMQKKARESNLSAPV